MRAASCGRAPGTSRLTEDTGYCPQYRWVCVLPGEGPEDGQHLRSRLPVLSQVAPTSRRMGRGAAVGGPLPSPFSKASLCSPTSSDVGSSIALVSCCCSNNSRQPGGLKSHVRITRGSGVGKSKPGFAGLRRRGCVPPGGSREHVRPSFPAPGRAALPQKLLGAVPRCGTGLLAGRPLTASWR